MMYIYVLQMTPQKVQSMATTLLPSAATWIFTVGFFIISIFMLANLIRYLLEVNS